MRERLKDSASADVIAGLRAKLAGADRVEVSVFLRLMPRLLTSVLGVTFLCCGPKPTYAKSQNAGAPWARGSHRYLVPRLAVTPVNSILNYLFSLLESESRLALTALGLDPSLAWVCTPMSQP